jgi:nanoRNase/pAp phosphatase (c-di-AMP/oligoRNAs hydrolase)
VWLGDGHGALVNSGQSIGSSTTTDVELFDIDEDGDLDLAIANHGAASEIRLNDGHGNFDAGLQTLATANTTGLAAIDVDVYPLEVLDEILRRRPGYLAGISPDVIIDHHTKFGGDMRAKQEIIDPSASSACEILYFMLKPTDRISCLCLLMGIISDSAAFKYATPATFEAASKLLTLSGISYSELISLSHAPESLSERIEAIRSCSSVSAEKVGERIIALAMAKSHEAHFADTLVSLGADVAFVGCESENGRISARARDSLKGHVRLDGIMSEVGKVMNGNGGGHEMAAGATGEKGSVREALAVCRKLAEQQILTGEKAKIRKIEW